MPHDKEDHHHGKEAHDDHGHGHVGHHHRKWY